MTNDQILAAKAAIIGRAWTDSAYLKTLVANPKEIIAREFAVDLPASLTVTVLTDTADTINLVLADPADLPDAEKAGPKAAILAKAWTDPAFRQALLADPAAALKTAFAAEIKAGTTIKAVEQTDDHAYIVIPARPDSLSDSDLDKVAGGISKTERENIELGSALSLLVIGGVAGGPLGAAVMLPPTAPIFYKDRDTIAHDGKVIGHEASKAGHAIGHAAKKICHGW